MDYLQAGPILIPMSELSFWASCAGGPGGQYVNTSNTKVTVVFDIARSRSLTEPQRQLLLERLASRLTMDGVLMVSCQESRSQAANKSMALEKLVEIITEALQPVKKRHKTKVPSWVRLARLQTKRHRSLIKAYRKKQEPEEEF
ncbi:MAG: alternative ribosome rescue aminoacyl-tRNA hydrolase ArfB [candidate division KSB1 bacterium]|nr:alternative ribosome rescue aminoacyl-tRNA hydrolase ArfB [candidate division KSB1 bacterium]